MPTGIGNGIAGDVFQNNLGAGGGGGLVCPSRYSWQGDGVNNFGQQSGTVYTLGAVNSSLSFWYKPIDIKGSTDLGAGLLTTDGFNFTSTTDPFNIYTSPSGVLTATLGPMIFPAHPELITNGSFTEVPVGAELIANPTFSDAASITPWNTTGAPNATLSWNARFMRMTYTVANGNALFDNMGQTLNTMYSVKMRVRGVTSAGADQGSAFDAIGDNTALTSANIISNPTLTSEYQDYEFRVWSTNATFRFYLASAAIGDVVDFDSISVKPLDMLVDNGNFSSLGADWTVIDNTAGDTVTFGASTNPTDYPYSATWTKTNPEAVYLQQDYPVTLGASHKLTYTILSNTYTGGGTELGLSSLSAYGQSPIPSSVGTHTVYLIVTLDTPDAALRFYSNDTGGSLEITNISVEELGEGWTSLNPTNTFGEHGLTMTSTEGADVRIRTGGILADSTSYKVTYTIHAVGLTGTNAIQYYTGSALNAYDDLPEQGVGTHTFYYTTPASTNQNWYFRLDLRDSTSTTDFVTISSVSVEEVLSENEWHHLALSIDRDSEWKWYVDGVLTNTMDNATDVAPLSGLSTLGLTNISTAIASFYGNMTEPSLWNIPLSSSEVKDIYDNMYGGQRCLGTLPFTSDLITNGNFSQIGPELITNGDFSATGSDVVINGTFATDTDWSKNSNWTISGGEAISDGTSSASINQHSILTEGVSYKISFEITEFTSGSGYSVRAGAGTTYPTPGVTSLGVHTFYQVATGNPLYGDAIYIVAQGNTIGKITNVTAEPLGEGWTLTDAIVSATPAGVGYYTDDGGGINAYAYQTILDSTKNYKTSFEILEFPGAGAVGISSSTTAGGFYPSAVGTFEKFLCPPNGTSPTQFRLVGNPPAAGFKMTNASVKEVGQGWDAEGTGSGVVTFPNGMARIETVAAPNSAYIRQYSVMEVGKSYTMTYRIVSNNGGTLYNSGQTPTTMDSTVGSHSETFIAGSSNLLISRFGNNTDISITNITLTQVGSGNLERWWRMNGTEPLLIDLPNVAPNGIVDDLNEVNSPGISPDVP